MEKDVRIAQLEKQEAEKDAKTAQLEGRMREMEELGANFMQANKRLERFMDQLEDARTKKDELRRLVKGAKDELSKEDAGVDGQSSAGQRQT